MPFGVTPDRVSRVRFRINKPKSGPGQAGSGPAASAKPEDVREMNHRLLANYAASGVSEESIESKSWATVPVKYPCNAFSDESQQGLRPLKSRRVRTQKDSVRSFVGGDLDARTEQRFFSTSRRRTLRRRCGVGWRLAWARPFRAVAAPVQWPHRSEATAHVRPPITTAESLSPGTSFDNFPPAMPNSD